MTIQEIIKGLQQDGHGTKAMGGQVADDILPYVKSAHALDRLGHGKIVVIACIAHSRMFRHPFY